MRGNETCESFAAGSAETGNAWLYGFDAGVGVDVAVMRNVFLRGEFEYVHFFPMKGITLDFSARVAPASSSNHSESAPEHRASTCRLTARLSLFPTAGHPSPPRGDYLEG